MNPWIPYEVHASPHDLPDYDEPLFPVADTPIGRIGCAICYDWLFPEAIRQLAANGAEVLLEASPGPGERIVVSAIDVSALRHERASRQGHHMLAHLRTEAYPVYAAHQYPPGLATASPQLSYERNIELIEIAKHSLSSARAAV